MAQGQSVEDVAVWELRRALAGIGLGHAPSGGLPARSASGPSPARAGGGGMLGRCCSSGHGRLLEREESSRLYTSAPVRGTAA